MCLRHTLWRFQLTKHENKTPTSLCSFVRVYYPSIAPVDGVESAKPSSIRFTRHHAFMLAHLLAFCRVTVTARWDSGARMNLTIDGADQEQPTTPMRLLKVTTLTFITLALN